MTSIDAVRVRRAHGRPRADATLTLEHVGRRSVVASAPSGELVFVTGDATGLMPGGVTLGAVEFERVRRSVLRRRPGTDLGWNLQRPTAPTSLSIRPTTPEPAAVLTWLRLLKEWDDQHGSELFGLADLRRATADLVASVPDRACGRTVARLIGAGPGTTPSGDDLIVGVLAGLWLTDAPAEREALTREVTPLLGRTTRASRHFLGHALAGDFAEPALRLVRALGGHGQVVLPAAALSRWGATSGVDVMYGLAAVLAPRNLRGALVDPVERAS